MKRFIWLVLILLLFSPAVRPHARPVYTGIVLSDGERIFFGIKTAVNINVTGPTIVVYAADPIFNGSRIMASGDYSFFAGFSEWHWNDAFYYGNECTTEFEDMIKSLTMGSPLLYYFANTLHDHGFVALSENWMILGKYGEERISSPYITPNTILMEEGSPRIIPVGTRLSDVNFAPAGMSRVSAEVSSLRINGTTVSFTLIIRARGLPPGMFYARVYSEHDGCVMISAPAVSGEFEINGSLDGMYPADVISQLEYLWVAPPSAWHGKIPLEIPVHVANVSHVPVISVNGSLYYRYPGKVTVVIQGYHDVHDIMSSAKILGWSYSYSGNDTVVDIDLIPEELNQSINVYLEDASVASFVVHPAESANVLDPHVYISAPPLATPGSNVTVHVNVINPGNSSANATLSVYAYGLGEDLMPSETLNITVNSSVTFNFTWPYVTTDPALIYASIEYNGITLDSAVTAITPSDVPVSVSTSNDNHTGILRVISKSPVSVTVANASFTGTDMILRVPVGPVIINASGYLFYREIPSYSPVEWIETWNLGSNFTMAFRVPPGVLYGLVNITSPLTLYTTIISTNASIYSPLFEDASDLYPEFNGYTAFPCNPVIVRRDLLPPTISLVLHEDGDMVVAEINATDPDGWGIQNITISANGKDIPFANTVILGDAHSHITVTVTATDLAGRTTTITKKWNAIPAPPDYTGIIIIVVLTVVSIAVAVYLALYKPWVRP